MECNDCGRRLGRSARPGRTDTLQPPDFAPFTNLITGGIFICAARLVHSSAALSATYSCRSMIQHEPSAVVPGGTEGRKTHICAVDHALQRRAGFNCLKATGRSYESPKEYR